MTPECYGGRVAGGTYAQKQLFGGSAILAWSHGSRFRMARALVHRCAGQRLLDYGCGDGTFLALVRDLFPDAVGADIDPTLVEEAAARFAGLPGLSFRRTDDLGSAADGSYGVAVCMEVLEHCTEEQVAAILADLRRLVKPDGLIVISVPIETGLSLIGKQLVRELLRRRRYRGYEGTESYGAGEFWRMVLAGPTTTIPRPGYTVRFAPGCTLVNHGHKGFNWRHLHARLAETLAVEVVRFSPLGQAGRLLGSQAWFVCRPRELEHAGVPASDRRG